MMNKYKFLLISAIILLSGGCKEKEDTSNRAYFTYTPENGNKLFVPVALNDNVTESLIFDTGAQFLSLDSMLYETHFSSDFDTTGRKIYRNSTGWNYKHTIRSFFYEKSLSLKIGHTDVVYPEVGFLNWKRFANRPTWNGLFNIPLRDSAHVWELNFESDYIEVHPVDCFKMPENIFLFPLDTITSNIHSRAPLIYFRAPLQITCADGDTLTMNRKFMIDTGMEWDIAVRHPAEEIAFFNEQEDAVWNRFQDGYIRHYTVNAILSDYFTMDSLRIYTLDESQPANRQRKYLVGLNFLKRFNVFFDMKNKQLGLQPIENFQRIRKLPTAHVHYALSFPLFRKTGKYIIDKIVDYPGNYYKEAGLQEGDELVKVNGLPYRKVIHSDGEVSPEAMAQFNGQETVVFDIIRDGKPMQIPVKINYNEPLQGD